MDTGKRIAVYPYTEVVEDCGKVTCYPLRPGHACTVHKLQGAELDHITVLVGLQAHESRRLCSHQSREVRQGLPLGWQSHTGAL
eukprot:1343736-Amphidinium_carterae.1